MAEPQKEKADRKTFNKRGNGIGKNNNNNNSNRQNKLNNAKLKALGA